MTQHAPYAFEPREQVLGRQSPKGNGTDYPGAKPIRQTGRRTRPVRL